MGLFGDVFDFVKDTVESVGDVVLTPVRTVGAVFQGDDPGLEIKRGFGGAVNILTAEPLISNSGLVKDFLEDTPVISDVIGKDIVGATKLGQGLQRKRSVDSDALADFLKAGAKIGAAAVTAGALSAPAAATPAASEGALLLSPEAASGTFGLGVEGGLAAASPTAGIGLGVDTALVGTGLEAGAFTAQAGLATVPTTGILGASTSFSPSGGGGFFSGLFEGTKSVLSGTKDVLLTGAILKQSAGQAIELGDSVISGDILDGGGSKQPGAQPEIVEVPLPIPIQETVLVGDTASGAPGSSIQTPILNKKDVQNIGLFVAAGGVAFIAWRILK